MADDNSTNFEIHELEEAARAASIYHEDIKKFERNVNLSNAVQVTFHLVEFTFATSSLTFHLVHHYLNQKAREINPEIPAIFEMWSPIFFISYPTCMLTSLVLVICRIFFNILDPRPEVIVVNSLIGCMLMMIGGISVMRHTALHIDLNITTDEQLEHHPVFIHNIVICVISIFGGVTYLIQGWVTYDCWFWRWKRRRDVDASDLNATSRKAETGKRNRDGEPKTEYRTKEEPGQLNPIAMLESVPTHTPTRPMNIEDEPVILHCCCVDLYNYARMEYFVKKPTHEFQVIHIM